MRTTIVLVAVGILSGCNGKNVSPTAPMSAPLSPVVREITVDRTRVEAGTELTLTATLENPGAAGPVRFEWNVTPAGGTLTNQGATARWRAPMTDPVPTAYVFTVAALAASTESSSTGGTLSASFGEAKSPPVTVNDAKRETQAHATAFLTDMANANASPELCVRNFAIGCGEGKQAAVAEISTLRSKYTAATTAYSLQLYLRSVEWANCTGPDRSAICALLVYTVDTEWIRASDGGRERTHGYQYLRALYEGDRWWLCSSRFSDNPNAIQ